MPEPAVLEIADAPEVVNSATLAAGADDVLALMRTELHEQRTARTAPAEVEAEAAQPAVDTVADAAPEVEGEAQPATSSRRGRGFEKKVETIQTEAEQKVSEATQRAETAETERQRIIDEYETHKATVAAEKAKTDKVLAEFTSLVGSDEEYAEATRLSRMDVDDPNFDFDVHKAAVANLNAWDKQRALIPAVTTLAEQKGRSEANAAIYDDFIEKLSKDLPESARDGYVKHKDGIAGAVRYYHQTLLAPVKEEYEGTIAELQAELDTYRKAGNGRGSPETGGIRAASGERLDYQRMSPEQMMAAELRGASRAAARGRR